MDAWRDAISRGPDDEAASGEAPAQTPGDRLDFRRLVEQSPVGTYVLQDGRFRFVNPKLAELLGYSVDELLALESAALLAVPADRGALAARLQNGPDGLGEAGPFGFRALRKDGEEIHVEVHEAVTQMQGRFAVIGALVDVTEHRRSENQLLERAFVDALTKLPNRGRFMERLGLELAQARRHDRRLAVVSLGVDRFKFVNDNWGHPVGDRVLQSLALRLKRGLRRVDFIARSGGDEFLILAPDLRRTEDMSQIAQKLVALAARPFELNGQTLSVTASVGVATFPDDGQEAEELLRNADVAMDRAKALGRNSFELCTPELTAAAVERLALQNGLRRALDQQQFVLHYQPIVSLHNGRIEGLEALVRWNHPERGLVAPGTFIALAEETGLILPLGDWVLRTACAQLATWNRTGLGLRISVNVSAHQFRDDELFATVARILAEAELEPGSLEVEITESIAMEDEKTVVANLNALREMGVGISIDDFGTGYSSLTYLKRYPVTTLKIDRSFVADLAFNSADAGIVRAVVEMAHGSHRSVIAEGVETREQFQILQDSRCDAMQGYWVGRPMSSEGIDERLVEELRLWKGGQEPPPPEPDEPF